MDVKRPSRGCALALSGRNVDSEKGARGARAGAADAPRPANWPLPGKLPIFADIAAIFAVLSGLYFAAQPKPRAWALGKSRPVDLG